MRPYAACSNLKKCYCQAASANYALVLDAAWSSLVVSGVRRMNEVNPRRARLLLGWVTVFGRVYHLGM